jgi:hypothetical protein
LFFSDFEDFFVYLMRACHPPPVVFRRGLLPARNYRQRLKLAEGTFPRELPYHCADQRRCAAIKYLERTTGAATGNGLGTTIKYLR